MSIRIIPWLPATSKIIPSAKRTCCSSPSVPSIRTPSDGPLAIAMVLRCVFDLSSMQKEHSLFLAGVSIGCGLCKSDRVQS